MAERSYFTMALKGSGVLYLQRDNFQIYTSTFPQVLEFRFVPEIVADLEVINKDLLGNIVNMFIANNKIPPCTLTIVLADNVIFAKDFLPTTDQINQIQADVQENAQTLPQNTPISPAMIQKNRQKLQDMLQNQAKEFIEHVPFECVVSKNVPYKDGIRAIAVNQQMYDIIKSTFEKQGFIIDSVLPAMLISEELGRKPALDVQTAAFILQKAFSLRQFNLLTQKIFEPEKKTTSIEQGIEPERLQNQKPGNKRLVLLSGVFGFLIIVLVVVYNISNPAPSQTIKSNAAVSTVTNTNTQPIANPPQTATIAPVVPTAVTQAVPVNTANALSVQIINASDSAQPSENLRQGLAKYGFKSMTVQNQFITAPSKGFIYFSRSVGPAVRNTITTEVGKITPNVSFQDSSTAQVDITIILNK